MNDYKELIKRLRVAVDVHEVKGCVLEISAETCAEIADAIEHLVKERDAAVADIDAMFRAETSEDVCKLCDEYPKHNCFYYSMQKPCNHKWRGINNE